MDVKKIGIGRVGVKMIKLVTHTQNPEELLKSSFGKCYQTEVNIDTIIKHLKHESVLEHVVFTFDVKCSRVCHLQFVRHRIASYTSQSHRYTEPSLEDLSYYIPSKIDNDTDSYKEWMEDCEAIYAIYKKWRSRGVKKEDARYLLPDATAINFQVTMNLRSILNFLALRTDTHAQDEIRYLAKEMQSIVFATMPNLERHLSRLVEMKQD
jgi:thymidylate synthase (FAD)